MNSNFIYNIIKTQKHNTHYLNRYIKFLEYCKKQNVKLTGNDKNTTFHHILPKSIWPEYSSFYKNKWNAILLTHRQHFIVHIILSNCLGGKMNTALFMMCKEARKYEYKVTNRTYEIARGRCVGKNHRSHIKTKYKFKNTKTGEIRICTRYDLSVNENIHKECIRSLFIKKSKTTKGWCVWFEDDQQWSNEQYADASGLNANCVDKKKYWFKNIKTGEEFYETRIGMATIWGITSARIGMLVRGTVWLSHSKFTIWNDEIQDWAYKLKKPKKGRNSPTHDKTKYTFKNKTTGVVLCCTRVELIEYDPSTTHCGIMNLVKGNTMTHKNWILIDHQ